MTKEEMGINLIANHGLSPEVILMLAAVYEGYVVYDSVTDYITMTTKGRLLGFAIDDFQVHQGTMH